MCSALLYIPLILLIPIPYILIAALGLIELWQIQDDNPRQFTFVNTNLLLKLFNLWPTALIYLAFAVVQDKEFYFFFAFLGFWLLAFGNVAFSMIYTAKLHGCKKRLLIATPSNSLFTK